VRKRRYRAEWVLLAVALLTIAAMVAANVFKDRQAIESQESDRLQVQARVIAESVARELEAVNRALEGIRNDFVRADAMQLHAMASRRMKAMTDALPGMSSVVYLDASGTVLAANQPQAIGQNLAHNPYFTLAQADHDPAKLYLSTPFRSAPDAFSINATKVLTGAQGEFAGVVTASLDPDYFNRVMRSVIYAPDMRASVVHGDGHVLVVVSANPEVSGRRPGRGSGAHGSGHSFR
jgi:C4-dicarboxylate-specific signal transduction histidine kinase